MSALPVTHAGLRKAISSGTALRSKQHNEITMRLPSRLGQLLHRQFVRQPSWMLLSTSRF